MVGARECWRVQDLSQLSRTRHSIVKPNQIKYYLSSDTVVPSCMATFYYLMLLPVTGRSSGCLTTGGTSIFTGGVCAGGSHDKRRDKGVEGVPQELILMVSYTMALTNGANSFTE